MVVQADVHRANVEEEDEDYDEVLEMEQEMMVKTWRQ